MSDRYKFLIENGHPVIDDEEQGGVKFDMTQTSDVKLIAGMLVLYDNDLSKVESELAALRLEAERLKAKVAELDTENITMYGAILEAAGQGQNAATRCKLELIRIARRDAGVTESAQAEPVTPEPMSDEDYATVWDLVVSGNANDSQWHSYRAEVERRKRVHDATQSGRDEREGKT